MAKDQNLEKEIRRIVREAGGIFISTTPSHDNVATLVLFSVISSDRVFDCALYPDDDEALITLKKCVSDTVRVKSAAAGGK
jgi:hypothetical protein